MPSPFPGMDPYLEDSGLWQGFHNALMVYVADAIQPQLPERYIAVLDARVYYERWSSNPADFVEVREASVTLRALPGRELVTTLELLSPSNKRPGEGRDQYLAKQRELLERRINLVEIDLLRAGKHTVAAPEGHLTHLAPFHYLACLFRRARPLGFEVFTWSVRDALPALPIPLAPEDAEVKLDLQAVFGETYDRGVFRRLLEYAGEAEPPLVEDDVPWADALLREAGAREAAGA